MSDNMWFMVNDEVYGFILAATPAESNESDMFIPQSLVPNSQEYYEAMTGDMLLSQLDEIVSVFPTAEGAQALMQFLYNSTIFPLPTEIVVRMMESLLIAFGGYMTTKQELGLMSV